MFAYSRDGGLPHWFDYVDRKGAPLRTIWLAVTLSFLLAIPSVGSTVAFAACTSIATIGLYLSYGIPVAIALFRPTFVKGPFDLGKWSKYVVLRRLFNFESILSHSQGIVFD